MGGRFAARRGCQAASRPGGGQYPVLSKGLFFQCGSDCSCRPVARMECCAFLARGVHLCCGEGLLCPVRARDIARACSVHPRKARAPRAPHSRLWLLCCRPGGGQLTPPAARCAGTPAVQEGGAGAKVDVGVGRWATRPRRIAVRVAGGPWAASSRLERRSPPLGARRAQRTRTESGFGGERSVSNTTCPEIGHLITFTPGIPVLCAATDVDRTPKVCWVHCHAYPSP